MNYKQVIIMRKDLGMRKGKMIAQGAHASMKVLLGMRLHEILTSESIFNWLRRDHTKIVVYVNSEEELLHLYQKSIESKISCSLIKDAGKTEFKEPTYTCVAVGPAPSEEVDKITSELPLL